MSDVNRIEPYLHDSSDFFPDPDARSTTMIASLRTLLEQLEGGNGVAMTLARAIGVRDLEQLVVRDYAMGQRRSSGRMRAAWRLHLVPYLGSVPLSEYPRAVPEYIDARLGSGAARATVQYELSLLRRGLMLAHRSRLIPERPWIPSVRVSNARRGFVTDPEFRRLQAALPEPLRSIATWAYRTGWRRQEILDLSWGRVDLGAGTARLDQTKNGSSRIFPFGCDPELVVLIEYWAGRRDESPFVFHREIGRKYSGSAKVRADGKVSWFVGVWRRACKEAGLPDLLLHDLRRSAARNMVRAGIPERVVQELCGWKTRAMLDRYHVIAETDLAEAVARAAASRRAG